MGTMAALTFGNCIPDTRPHRRLQAPSDLQGLGLLRIHPLRDLTSLLDLDRPTSNQILSMQVPQTKLPRAVTPF